MSVYNQHFNSGSVVFELDVREYTVTMIVINSVFFFLMFAYFNDPQGSAIVTQFCTPMRPVLAAMIL